MSGNEPPKDQNPPSPKARRPSFNDLFASRPNMQRPQPGAMSAAFSQQAQEASRTRRLSTTGLGLSASPTHAAQTNTPFGNLRRHAGSVSDAGSGAGIDESAIDESGPPLVTASEARAAAGGGGGAPGSPSSRRMSIGARAYGVARSASLSYPNGGGGGGGSGGGMGQSGPSPPAGGTKKDGYDFSENLRSRAERASVSGQAMAGAFGHSRSRSQAVEVAASAPSAPVVVPKPSPKQNVPDHFQERILKGDFYMD